MSRQKLSETVTASSITRRDMLSFKRQLRIVVCVLSAWSAIQVASAQPSDPLLTANSALDQAELEIKTSDSQLDRLTDTTARRLIRAKLAVVRTATGTAVATLQDQLDRIDARVAELGPAPANAPELDDIRLQRRQLTSQRGITDSALKRGRLLRLESQQLIEELDASQTEKITETLSKRTASPLSPSFWAGLANEWPTDMRRVAVFISAGVAACERIVVLGNPLMALSGALLAVVFLFPIRFALRRTGLRFLRDELSGHRLRRSVYAWWRVAVGTAVPSLAALVFVTGMRWAGFVEPRWDAMLDTLIWAAGISAFIASLGGTILLRGQPGWRLLPIADDVATNLRFWTWVLAAIAFAVPILDRFNTLARASPAVLSAAEMIEAGLNAALIAGVLVSVARLRARRADNGVADGRSGGTHVGTVASILALWCATVASVLGALIGYVGFSLFVSRFVTWFVIVAGTLYLLVVVIDDVATGFLSSRSRLGRMVLAATGLRRSTIDQTGVLLSGLLRLVVALFAISLLLAPFGAGTSAVFDRLGILAQGLTVGQVTIAPMAIVRAITVLAVALMAAKTFQRWLIDRYLPATELDAGARNSIALISRYIGVLLAILWGLASLGIGVERIALLLSALSVGIGFGLQAITQNFVSGLILLAERPIKIGDLVRIGNDEGDVKRINVRSTEIEMADHSTLIVPNSELITKSVLNKTSMNAMGRIQIQFSVPIEVDVKRIRDIVLDLFAAQSAILDKPVAAVFVDNIADGRVAFNCHAHVENARAVYPTRSAVLLELLDQLHKDGIEIGSSPQRLELVSSGPEGVRSTS
ncbi:DUF3772 domain-containing protein [Sphingomonas sp. GB1N7]|uniref:DUF3772 domain-containing protein n=1 Tax=Parasphingomonas caseinilytica TaxID=3096158 RepID=UPI002FC8C229